MRRMLSLAALVLAASLPQAAFDAAQARAFDVAQATQELPEYGPAKGTLVIVGGGTLTGSGISEKFIELAGGPEKNFVIVPTAGGNRNAQGQLIPYRIRDVDLEERQRVGAMTRDIHLELEECRSFRNGCVYVSYRVKH